MACGEFLVKYLLIFANVFFALAGLVYLGIGVAVQVKVPRGEVFQDYNVAVVPVLAIVTGLFLFLVALFGCYGARKRNNCMINTYGIFMISLVVLDIVLAVVIFANLNGFLDDLPQFIDVAFFDDPINFSEAFEAKFKCCGPKGAISYLPNTLPDTCCAKAPCHHLDAYEGCRSNVETFAVVFGSTLGAIAILLAAAELVAVVFSICLSCCVRRNNDRRREPTVLR